MREVKAIVLGVDEKRRRKRQQTLLLRSCSFFFAELRTGVFERKNVTTFLVQFSIMFC